MRVLFFIILAGYAVRCDDASYYVIEMPDETREYRKPFRVYWNVPTKQCKSKKIPFEQLFERYGIIQNTGDSFIGDKVAILYDPGLFPALLKNDTSKKFTFRNGGVPQEGDLEEHLLAFRNTVEQSIPDENFNGVGIIDFESWRPVFRQNFGVLIPYKDISVQIERRRHPWWSTKSIESRARQRFDEAARLFMQTTISIAKQIRPHALWGYYAFPYCFNMRDKNNMKEQCADNVPQENNRIQWLWSESTALYPSLYSSKDLTSPQLAALVRGRVAEAARLRRRGAPVLPYIWFRYRDGGFLSQTDLNVLLETLYKSEASGFIIWGSSSDVNTVDKCKKLWSYTTDVLGPAIAKYTKDYGIRNTTGDSENNQNLVSSFLGLTTWRPGLKDHLRNANITEKPAFLDPDYHWVPPENYTQDIEHYVEQEFKKKPGYSENGLKNQTVIVNSKKNLLLELILNLFRRDMEESENDTVVTSEELDFNHKVEFPQAIDATSTVIPKIVNHDFEQSTPSMPVVYTKNPLDIINESIKDNQSSTERKVDSDSFESSTLRLNTFISVSTPYFTTRSYDAYIDQHNQKINKDETLNERLADDKSSLIINKKNDEIDEQMFSGSNITVTKLGNVSNDNKTNDNKLSSIEKFNDFVALENNTTLTNKTVPSRSKNLESQENVVNIGLNEPQENSTFELSTLGNLKVFTQTSPSPQNREVISTSHEFLTMPLFSKLEENLSTKTSEELLNYSFNYTTTEYVKNISINDETDTTVQYILSKTSNETYTKSNENVEYFKNNRNETELSDSTTPSLVITTDSLTTEKEAIQENVTDYNLSLDLIETSTEDILTVPEVKDNKYEDITNLETEKTISTNSYWTDFTESSTSNGIHFIVGNGENVPDNITEDDSIEANTTDEPSTTDLNPQVIGASRSSTFKMHYSLILLSLSVYNL